MYNHHEFFPLADLLNSLRRLDMAVKAYVLVVTDPGKTAYVVNEIRKLPNIGKMHEVMGPYDIVAEIEVETLQEIPPILGESIRSIEGIQSTTSLVTLPE